MPYKDVAKRKAYASQYQKDHPHKEDPEHRRIRFIKWRYGLSVEEYDEMFRRQDGKCAACGERSTKYLCVDHDHKTGKIRRLLCCRCNLVLGLVEDEPEILARLQKYLLP